jgi:iron complex transport system ATP-binding protein
MSVLKAEGVRVAVGSRVLVDDLDLEIGPGELLVILGRNGTGKTLLLHTLAGLRAPTAGAVRLDGRPLADIGRRQVALRLGLLLQIYEDAFPLRVLDAVLVGRHPHLGFWQWEGTVDHEIAHAALAAMDLEGMEDRVVATLSGGERRRLAIATLLAQEPAGVPPRRAPQSPRSAAPDRRARSLRGARARRARGRRDAARSNLAARFGTRALLLHGDGRWQCGAIPDVLTATHLSALFRTPIVQVPAQIGAVFVSGGPG